MTTPRLTITLPWPVPELSPNYHGPMRPKWAAQQAAKSDGYLSTLEGLQLAEADRYDYAGGALTVAVTFHPPNKRKRDRDNAQASLKHQFDGVAQALGVNDAVFEPSYKWGEVRRGGAVVLVIERQPLSAGLQAALVAG